MSLTKDWKARECLPTFLKIAEIGYAYSVSSLTDNKCCQLKEALAARLAARDKGSILNAVCNKWINSNAVCNKYIADAPLLRAGARRASVYIYRSLKGTIC